MDFRQFFFVVVRSFTADSNLLQPTGGVNSTPHTSHFLVCHSTHFNVTLTLAQEQGVWRALHTCVIFMRSMMWLFRFSTTLPSTLCCPSSLSSPFSSSRSSPPSMWRTRTLRTLANEDLGTLAENAPLTGCEANFIDNYHISETTDIIIQESSGDGRPSNLHDLEFDDYTIGRALSSPLFTQEREDPASRRQVYHSRDESLLSSQSSSVGHVGRARTERPVANQFGSLISNVRENPRHDSESEQIRILLERQTEQNLADCQAEIRKHEFQADYDSRSIQKLNEIIESQRGELYRAHQGDEQYRRHQQLFHEQLLEQKSGTS